MFVKLCSKTVARVTCAVRLRHRKCVTSGFGTHSCDTNVIELVQVRLDKASMPAPAVASLYLNGNIARMLTPERALYQTAMHLTWPAALTNDDEYLCCQISELLLDDSERQGLDRNLPR